MRADPLVNPEPLIRRIYSYVAYRLGDGPEAEDVTSEVFERALRYRSSYDEARGNPLQWLLGIARNCIEDARASRTATEPLEDADRLSPADVERDVTRRLDLSAAIDRLDERARDLLALRYGADLTARQIAGILGVKTNAVEVALHRTLARLRDDLDERHDAGWRAGSGSSVSVAPRTDSLP
jgi:RNA polymerase sigma-70 factor (ECF subfamily)